MAPNRASSPTALLFAHSLKREHGFILDRVQQLEAVVSRVEAAEKNAQAVAAKYNIADIANKVQTLCENEDSNSKAVEAIEKDIDDRLGVMQAGMDAVALRIDAVEKVGAVASEERRRASQLQEAMLTRLGEVEQHLKSYQLQLQVVEGRNEAGTVDLIRKQLGRLEEQVKNKGNKEQDLREDISMVDEAVKALQKGVEELANKYEGLALRPPPLVTSQIPTVPTAAPPILPEFQTEVTPDEPLKQRPFKSTSKQTARAARLTKAPSSSTGPTRTSQRAPRRVQVKTEGASSKKPDASKLVVPTLASQRTARKIPVKTQAKDKPGKPIVSAGRGFIVVSRTPSVDEAEVSEELGRGRGLPRAAKPLQSIETEIPGTEGGHDPSSSSSAIADQPPPRKRKLEETDDAQAMPAPLPKVSKKRKAETFDNETPNPVLFPIPATRATRQLPITNETTADETPIQEETTSPKKKGIRRGLTSIFSSPLSSPPVNNIANLQKLPDNSVLTEMPKPDIDQASTADQPRKRRTIQQDPIEVHLAGLKRFLGGSPTVE